MNLRLSFSARDNYISAKDTFWSAWSDNSIRQWLVDHGYVRSDAQVNRDELVKLANEKFVHVYRFGTVRLTRSLLFRYKDQHAKLSPYLTWPDARLRAYLREHGLSEEYIPGDRPSLLRKFRYLVLQTIIFLSFVAEETRIRWVQAQTNAEVLFTKIKELVNSGVYKAEDALHRLLSLLIGGWEDSKDKASAGYENVKDAAYENAKSGWEETKRKSGDAYDASSEWAEDTVNKGRENVGEKVKAAGDKIKGEL